MQEFNDIELAERARQGEIEAVGELYKRHQLRIYRYVRARIYNDQLAHDLTGDIFVRMVANLHTYQATTAPFSAWLYRIAHNYLVNHMQKEQGFEMVSLDQANMSRSTAVNPATIIEQQMQMETVFVVLNQLENDQREVLTLRFLAGLSLQEVADMLEKSVTAVKSIQHRGLKTMKALLR